MTMLCLSTVKSYVTLFKSQRIGGIMAEVLVVTSKVKKFIKEKGEMNTSAETVDMLSKAVERLCAKGIEAAKADGRKTVMARDIIIDHI
jgi:histone H3/H4